VPRWKAFEESEPEFAARVHALFNAGRHKTIATLRADGSPRISGTECEFADGDLTFGSMTGARKGADLRRDPRFALHGPTVHPVAGKESEWPGEAKIAGCARLVGAGAQRSDSPAEVGGAETAGAEAARAETADPPDMFIADITEVVVTCLNAEATRLVVESWTPERGLRRIERD
jgi:hypothetical protein